MNPQADARNQCIYSFLVTDRENYTLQLESEKGMPIGKNLSLFDLFSFDVVDNSSLRANFEDAFQKYEASIEIHTKSLLTKLNARGGDAKAQVINLFAAKLLNLVRNPFSIQKVLNTFPCLASMEPTDPGLLESYHRIVLGKKPHQAYLCSLLGISDRQYIEWLQVLFMLLVPLGDGHLPFFEQIIKGIFENRKFSASVFVYEYDKHHCLLCDRGCNQPLPDDDKRLSLSFNLCSTAFIYYIFAEPREILKGRFPAEVIEKMLANYDRRPTVEVNVSYYRNDMEMLAKYNRHVIEYSYARVYCAVKDGLVL